MVNTSTTSLQPIKYIPCIVLRKPTPTWSDRLPLKLPALCEETLDPADRAAFAGFGLIHNATGKVHHRAVGRSRDSGAQGIGSAPEGRRRPSYIPRHPTLGFQGPNKKDRLPWNASWSGAKCHNDEVLWVGKVEEEVGLQGGGTGGCGKLGSSGPFLNPGNRRVLMLPLESLFFLVLFMEWFQDSFHQPYAAARLTALVQFSTWICYRWDILECILSFRSIRKGD